MSNALHFKCIFLYLKRTPTLKSKFSKVKGALNYFSTTNFALFCQLDYLLKIVKCKW